MTYVYALVVALIAVAIVANLIYPPPYNGTKGSEPS